MVTIPVIKPEASPVALSLATLLSDELQTAVPVRSTVLLSLYVPVAVNCWVLPTNKDGLTGLTVRLFKTAGVTVRIVELWTEPEDAVIVVRPAAKPVARPPVLIVATDGVEQTQLTDAVRSCRLPSLNTPVAMNGRVVPAAMVGFAGAKIMVDKVALVTVSSVEPLTAPADATIVA